MTDQTKYCPICRETAVPYMLGDKEGYRYEACRACGSAQLEPFPTQSAIETFMAEVDAQLVHIARPEQRIATIEKILKKTLPPATPGKTRLLDVNALHGYATQAARNLGYQTVGINTWQYAHEFAVKHFGEGGFMHSRMQDYVETQYTKANVILCAKIFSQQTDQESFTQALKQALAPGGVIYIEEDDGNHLNTPRDLNGWPVVEPPLTCTLLAKKGMQKILARHGLRVRKSFFTWAPYMRLLVEHAK